MNNFVERGLQDFDIILIRFNLSYGGNKKERVSSFLYTLCLFSKDTDLSCG